MPLCTTARRALFTGLLLLCFPVVAETPLDALKADVAEIAETRGVAALGIALIEQGELVWLDALGAADPDRGVPATPDTLFRTASISKMFIALAALELAEAGRLDLETPVRELAPEIDFHNPWETEHPVRLSHLLEHTAGWNDAYLVEYAHRPPETLALGEALALYPSLRRSRWIPGSRAAYSNSGSAVAAYVVEKVAGMPYEQYLAQRWFEPLGMDSASFFEPAPGQSALAYGDGGAKPYWHLLYRPVGALNASPRELAALVHLLLNRGEYQGRQLLPPEAITRMETPQTSPAYEQGVRVGYGLSNYTSGYDDYGIAFYGHSGSLPGAFTKLLYSPTLDSGYVLLITGGRARNALDTALRDYLLRDIPRPTLHPAPLPENFRHLDGLYRHLNPRHDRRDTYLPVAFRAQRIEHDEHFLYRQPLFDNGDRRQPYYYPGDGSSASALVDPGTGLPAAAIVNDPMAGPVLHMSGEVYQRVAAWRLWGELGLWGAVLAGSLLALALLLIKLPMAMAGRHKVGADDWLLVPPVLTSLLLGAALISLARLPTTDFILLASLNPSTLSVFMFSTGYALAAVASAPLLYRLSRNPAAARAPWQRRIAGCLCLLHLVMLVYLASKGLIGLRIWTW